MHTCIYGRTMLTYVRKYALHIVTITYSTGTAAEAYIQPEDMHKVTLHNCIYESIDVDNIDMHSIDST